MGVGCWAVFPHLHTPAEVSQCIGEVTLTARDFNLCNCFNVIFRVSVRGRALFHSEAISEFCQLFGYLQHSSDSDCLPVPETLQSTSYPESLPAVPNTAARSFHPDPSPDTPSEGCSETSTSSKGSLETSLDSTPSNLNSALTSFGDSPSYSRDRAAPVASDIKGCAIKVIHDIKGRGWSGLVGNAG